MKDFPVFTTEYGAASLVLREIPYRQEAYIRIQASGEPDKLLNECVSFCRACGAEKIYAAGDNCLDAYPLHTSILEMRGEARVEQEKMAQLFPVTERTVARWREIANRCLAGVDNAGTLAGRDEKRILESGGAYFVHEEGELLGIGWLDGEMLALLAAVKPGAGERVAHTLISAVEGAFLTLEVASTNRRAIRLYEKLGFVRTGERTRWHRVF